MHAAAVAATAAQAHVVSTGDSGGTVSTKEEYTMRGFEGHTGTVSAVCVAADGATVLSASEDGSVRVWDAASRQQLRLFSKHSGKVCWWSLECWGY